MSPAFPNEINNHPKVRNSFQANLSMEVTYFSSPEAGKTAKVTERAIEAAQKAVRKTGMHSVDRICARGSNKQLIVMGMQSTRSADPGPRVFGLTTTTDVTLEEMETFLRGLI